MLVFKYKVPEPELLMTKVFVLEPPLTAVLALVKVSAELVTLMVSVALAVPDKLSPLMLLLPVPESVKAELAFNTPEPFKFSVPLPLKVKVSPPVTVKGLEMDSVEPVVSSVPPLTVSEVTVELTPIGPEVVLMLLEPISKIPEFRVVMPE